MKGAVIVARSPKFVEWAATILDQSGYRTTLQDQVLQISDEGRLLTFHGSMSDLKDFFPFPEIDEIQNRELLNDMSYACLVDCRWEDLFCRIMKDLAKSGSGTFVVVDNGGTASDPAALDPASVRL